MLFNRLSLRQKFLAILLPIIAVLSALMLWVIIILFQQLVGGLASAVAANRVQADSRQMSRLLVTEVTMAELLLSDREAMLLFTQPKISELTASQANLLERYRQSFAEQNLFIAHKNSAAFFYFDGPVGAGGLKPLYTLSADDIDDQWFYQAESLGPGCHLNVDFDRGVQTTKVWFNCAVMSESNELLAIIGSGLELSQFIESELVSSVAAAQKIFVDARGAIQLHENRTLISQDAFTLDETELNLLSDIIGEPAWQQAKRYFSNLDINPQPLVLDLVAESQQVIAAIAFVPEINWYGVVLIDRGKIVSRAFFVPLISVLVFMVMVFTVVLYYTFHKIFLQRLLKLDNAVSQYKPGHEPLRLPSLTEKGDEITRLERHIVEVSSRFFDYTQNLESLIQQRTHQLEHLAATDDLTGCANRRSFMAKFEAELRRSERHRHQVGLLVLDLDDFKQVNDEYGHAVGDLYLKGFVEQCKLVLRDSDLLGRLGGDEFAVLLIEATEDSCKQASARIHSAISEWTLTVDGAFIVGSVSIGYALMQPDRQMSASKLMEVADKAMYRHKQRHANKS